MADLQIVVEVVFELEWRVADVEVEGWEMGRGDGGEKREIMGGKRDKRRGVGRGKKSEVCVDGDAGWGGTQERSGPAVGPSKNRCW